MKYTVLPYDDSLVHGPLRYLIDKDSDIGELPTDCSVGSKAIVAESGNIYLLNNQHEWKKQTINIEPEKESTDSDVVDTGTADNMVLKS